MLSNYLRRVNSATKPARLLSDKYNLKSRCHEMMPVAIVQVTPNRIDYTFIILPSTLARSPEAQ